jgi:hypothetical protein
METIGVGGRAMSGKPVVFCKALSVALIALSCEPMAAAASPKELYGKSVVLTWSETLEPGSGKLDRAGVYVVFTTYVSTAGRLFTQILRGGSTGSHRTLTAVGYEGPGERSAGKRSNAEFQGHSLVITSLFENGARRIVVDFDSGFSSCQGKVIHGKEQGKNTMRHTGLNGQSIEVRAVSVSSVSCAIREGNALSGT